MRNVKGRRTSSGADSLMDAASSHSAQSSLNGYSGGGGSGGSASDALPLPPVSSSSHDFHYLQLPNLPFDPDFHICLAALADVLMDAYAGLLALMPTPESCAPGTAEAFAKADKQLRKLIVSGVVTEFESNTRKEARAEVGGLGRLVLSGLM